MDFDASGQESSRRNLMNLSGVIILYFAVGASIGTPGENTDLSLLGGTLHITETGLVRLYVFIFVVHIYFFWRAYTHFEIKPFWSYFQFLQTTDISQLKASETWTKYKDHAYVKCNEIGPTFIGSRDQGNSELKLIAEELKTSRFPLVEVFPNLVDDFDRRSMIAFSPASFRSLKKLIMWRTSFIADNFMFWIIPSVAAVLLVANALPQVCIWAT